MKILSVVEYASIVKIEYKFTMDGKSYHAKRIYNRVENNHWKISYETNENVPFCKCCGLFTDHYQGKCSIYFSGYSCGEYENISSHRLSHIRIPIDAKIEAHF